MIGRYQVLAELGAGGMGKVYKAFDTKLKRTLALKVLLGNHSQQLMQRFLVEAQAMAKLNHPNIVCLHGAERIDNIQFLTMDFIEGCSLDKQLKTKKIGFRKGVALMIKVIKALEYAHSQNIIHRDLKPANIMIDKKGEPFVMDFGLAKDLDTNQNLTKTGMIMGTPHYMPPEQIQGKRRQIDARTDIYSLGVMLYEIVCGKTPFYGFGNVDLMVKIVEATPSAPSKINPKIPKKLDKICFKALSKKRKDRYQNAGDMVRDLQEVLKGKSIGKTSQWQKSSKLVAILCALVIFATVFLLGKSSKKDVPKKALAVKKSQKKLLQKNTEPKNSKIKHKGNVFYQLKETLWEFFSRTRDVHMQIVFSKDTAYIGTINEIEAVDLQTGQSKKRINIPYVVKMEKHKDRIFAKPRFEKAVYVFSENNLNRLEKFSTKYQLESFHEGFFYSQNSTVFCVQNLNQKVIWEKQITKDFRYFPDSQKMYYVLNKALHKLNLKTGKTQWESLPEKELAKINLISKNNLIVCWSKNVFFVLDDTTGKLKWQKEWDIVLPPKQLKSKMYIVTKDNKIYVVKAKNGEHISTMVLDSEGLHNFELENEYGIYCRYLKGIYAYDLKAKKKRWSFHGKGYGNMVVKEKHIYFASTVDDITPGYFYVLDSKTGKAKWVFEIRGKTNTLMSGQTLTAIKNNRIYLYGGRGPSFLFALNKKTSPQLEPHKFAYMPLSNYKKHAYISFQTQGQPKIHQMDILKPGFRFRPVKGRDCTYIATGDLFDLYFYLPYKFKKVIFQFNKTVCTSGSKISVTEVSLRINNQFVGKGDFNHFSFFSAGFDISKFSKQGKNRITFRVEKAEVGSWLRELAVFIAD